MDELNIKCPQCGKNLAKTQFGYGCSSYASKEEYCGFSIGRICGVNLEEKDIEDLITKGITRPISDFISKKNKNFTACLKLEVLDKDIIGTPYNKAQISFDFDAATKETTLECPKCGKLIRENDKKYYCDCGFGIWKTIAGRELTFSEVQNLITSGSVFIEGFTSKKGDPFDARLVLNEKYETNFAFF